MSFLYSPTKKRRKLFAGICVSAVVILIAAGVFARNDWFPRTDAMSGQRYGWFGKKLPKNASVSSPHVSKGSNAERSFIDTINPFLSPPSPTPTPQLSREYIYAGSRLLAVEDANASAVPPADLAVWRPSNGTWYVMGGTGSAQTTQQWGNIAENDVPFPGDFDGDGKTDFTIYRPTDGYWYIIKSSDGTFEYIQWGNSADTPAAADYDGDGKTDCAIVRPDEASLNQYRWYIRRSSDSGSTIVDWGDDTQDDHFAPADYDGDGKADLSIWRNSNTMFYTLPSTDPSQSVTVDFASTATSDKPVSADYDGDGKADYAVRSGTNGTSLTLQLLQLP